MSEHLIDHSYTVLEIERMRAAVKRLLSLATVFDPNIYPHGERKPQPCQLYFRAPTAEPVEMQLRTYMLAGIRPEELEARASEYERAERDKWQDALIAEEALMQELKTP